MKTHLSILALLFSAAPSFASDLVTQRECVMDAEGAYGSCQGCSSLIVEEKDGAIRAGLRNLSVHPAIDAPFEKARIRSHANDITVAVSMHDPVMLQDIIAMDGSTRFISVKFTVPKQPKPAGADFGYETGGKLAYRIVGVRVSTEGMTCYSPQEIPASESAYFQK